MQSVNCCICSKPGGWVRGCIGEQDPRAVVCLRGRSQGRTHGDQAIVERVNLHEIGF